MTQRAHSLSPSIGPYKVASTQLALTLRDPPKFLQIILQPQLTRFIPIKSPQIMTYQIRRSIIRQPHQRRNMSHRRICLHPNWKGELPRTPRTEICDGVDSELRILS
ncbi:hypothetical protein HYC85_025202 [Camellia sinensis]|uniref:Uncharacterized protein n=1 Tax=Camellia sinensis TaxID=4442 RepID=A0A7J7GED1_CAMSI|nr:hypothetical protein HYC85_025202 [Camellia sinensis]